MKASSTGVGENAGKRGAGLPDDEAGGNDDDDDDEDEDIYPGDDGLSPVDFSHWRRLRKG